ncbi:MAG: alkaline phosphatase family protein [Gammaproteobacteria bacterium]|nr:alkaline phosphatase family protein [Gammaproteobacteria bacterium]
MDDSFIYKTERPWPNPRFKRAAIVGHTTHDSARIWFRTGRPGDFTLLLYPADIDKDDAIFKGFKTVPYKKEALDALPAEVLRIHFNIKGWEKDTTEVIPANGLKPGTEYCYALFSADENKGRIVLGQDRQHSFRTLPAAAGAISFGFFSCHMPYKKTLFKKKTAVVNMEMWDCFNEVLARHQRKDLAFVIGGGDQVYVDGVPTLSIWKYLNKVMRKEGGKLFPDKKVMVSWYRDIYRGYWGFGAVRSVFSNYPTYMVWDDHEMGDGWGSFYLEGEKPEINEIFPKAKKNGLSKKDCLELLDRMGEAGKQVYTEYQHSRNPATGPKGSYDFHFTAGRTAHYFLDGRGFRDINRKEYRVLGKKQFDRFAAWLANLDPNTSDYVFITTAVPLLHMKPALVNADDNPAMDLANLQDDLRDAWEHELHDKERKALVDALFTAAARGLKICILSGDVHTSAAFKMTRDGNNIYQLTSSAITYNKSRTLGWILGNTVPDDGESEDGYHYERLALYTGPNFSLIKVDPGNEQVVFQLYGHQKVSHPDAREEEMPMTHSIAKIKLRF